MSAEGERRAATLTFGAPAEPTIPPHYFAPRPGFVNITTVPARVAPDAVCERCGGRASDPLHLPRNDSWP